MTPAPAHPYRTPSPQPSGRLPLASVDLQVYAEAGHARVVLRQTFVNDERVPLCVSYKLPLPADGAVSDFAFTIGEQRTHGVVQGKQQARETYEHALLQGHSAALLEQEREDLFQQELGNIPPGQQVVVEVTIDQPLAWFEEELRSINRQAGWEWRFPLTAVPRYLGAAPGPTLAVVDVDTGARASLELHIADATASVLESSSHALAGPDPRALRFADGERTPLDRDVVVRWSAALEGFGPVLRETTHQGRRVAWLTLMPPAPAKQPRRVPRDLTLLLDTSGSMMGEPLEQQKRIACALLDSLDRDDTLELIEFSDRPRAMLGAPARVTETLQREAIAWVRALHARGGTEMISGVMSALRELREESQRQIVLITDGLIGFEQQLVTTVFTHLPKRARLHAVGVGPAVNRAMLAPIARAGRGREIVVSLGDDAERACSRLLAATAAPLAVDLELTGDAVLAVYPSRLPDVFAHAPLRIAVELRAEGGPLQLRGRTREGIYREQLSIAPQPSFSQEPGAITAIAKSFAREAVADLEMLVARSSADRAALERDIEHLGLDFQIATRLTSWVAVSEQATVDPREPTRHVQQPHRLPRGLSALGFGLPAAAPTPVGTFNLSAQSSLGASPQPRRRALGMPTAQSLPGGAPPRAAMPTPPPPPAPEPMLERKAARPSRREGLLDRAKKLFRRTKQVRGRLVRLDDERVVLSFDAPPFALQWSAWTALAILPNGSTITLELQVDESTHEGLYLPTLQIRVVLDGRPLTSAPREVLLECADEGYQVLVTLP